MPKGSRITCIGLLIASLVSLTACMTNVHEKRQNQAMINAIDFKPWDEAANRLPQEEHRKQIASLAKLFPGVVFYKGPGETPTQPKRVALTFDDGPDNYYTPKILSILREKGVPATFFMVGSKAHKFPDMAKRIVNEGHDIGNHSFDHPKFSTLSQQKVVQEIQSTEAEIQSITGRRTDLFRPPYGLLTADEVKQVHGIGYRVIDWSVDTTDWKGTSEKQILSLVSKEISPGGIMLQHCLAGRPGELDGTVKALPHIIDYLHSLGYQFVTIHTLLGK